MFLWRYPVRRLDGEIMRDVILSASGQINLEAGGPPFFPSLPQRVRSFLFMGNFVRSRVLAGDARIRVATPFFSLICRGSANEIMVTAGD